MRTHAIKEYLFGGGELSFLVGNFGATLVILSVVIWVFAALSKRYDVNYGKVSEGLFVIYLAASALYLLYPGFLDHVEATVASFGPLLRNGKALYPWPDLYPYYGLLYGPGVGATQWLFSYTGLPVIFSSKLAGVIAFAVFVLILLRVIRSTHGRGYLLFLFPFGHYLFWNRAEPFLLLLVTITLLFGEGILGSGYFMILVGVLAGLASAYKIHGVFYILSAYLAVLLVRPVSARWLFAVPLAAMAAFFSFFLIPGIHPEGQLGYLRLASHHGLSATVLITNLSYIIALGLPLAIVIRNSGAGKNKTGVILILILLLELFVALIGSKPGSGTYHLAPFIPVNAFLLQFLCKNRETPLCFPTRIVYNALVFVGLMAIWTFFHTLQSDWKQATAVSAEARQHNMKYPGLVMGITDESNYPLTYYRLFLDAQQVDYTAYMDLNFAGVDDHQLTERLGHRDFPYIMMPRYGAPFAKKCYYTKKNLFSEKTVRAFNENYEVAENGKYYTIMKAKDAGL